MKKCFLRREETMSAKKIRILTCHGGECCSKKCPGLSDRGSCKHFGNRILNLVLSEPDKKLCCWHIIAHKRCDKCFEYMKKNP